MTKHSLLNHIDWTIFIIIVGRTYCGSTKPNLLGIEYSLSHSMSAPTVIFTRMERSKLFMKSNRWSHEKWWRAGKANNDFKMQDRARLINGSRNVMSSSQPRMVHSFLVLVTCTSISSITAWARVTNPWFHPTWVLSILIQVECSSWQTVLE